MAITTKTRLFVLMAALGVCFAIPASAEPGKGQGGGKNNAEQILPALVVDSDGDIVGSVAGIDHVSGSSGPQPPVGVHVIRDGRYLGFIGSQAAASSIFDILDMNHGNRGPFFTQPDCQGTPYLHLESIPTQALFLNYYYQDPIAGHGVIAVLDDQSQTPQTLTFQSSASGNGAACDPSNATWDVIALTIDQTGLPLFQPNFSIVSQ